MADSWFMIHGHGYWGKADSLDAARAIAKQMGGGIIYVHIDLVRESVESMEREAAADEPPDDSAFLY